MFEVIVVKEDALQIVDDHIDCPVGGIPNPFVIGSWGVWIRISTKAFSKYGRPVMLS